MGDEVFQGLPTILQQRGYTASADWKRKVAENVPVVQPVYNLRHLLNQEYTVSVYRISSENPNSPPWDPLLDVVENRLPNGFVGMRRFQACFCETRLPLSM